MPDFNTKIFYLINGLATLSQNWDIFFLTITATGFCLALLIAVLFFLFWHHHRGAPAIGRFLLSKNRELLIVSSSVLATYVVVQVLKVLFAIPRPFLTLENVKSLILYGANNSFPSGHAATFSALAMAVYFYHRPLGLSLGVLALLIGFSRIYVGVHYPVDVLAGFLIGIFVSVLIRKIFDRTKPKV